MGAWLEDEDRERSKFIVDYNFNGIEDQEHRDRVLGEDLDDFLPEPPAVRILVRPDEGQNHVHDQPGDLAGKNTSNHIIPNP
jgi:hypothetical protein